MASSAEHDIDAISSRVREAGRPVALRRRRRTARATQRAGKCASILKVAQARTGRTPGLGLRYPEELPYPPELPAGIDHARVRPHPSR